MTETFIAAQQGKSIEDTFRALCEEFPGQVVFTTSFGYEDQVVTDIIAQNNFPVQIVTLDTGRLFEETYKVYSRTLDKYKISIKAFAPSADDTEALLAEQGPFGFYESLEARKKCCYVRKVVGLRRSLADAKVWVTGLRSEQSEAREELFPLAFDQGFNLIKFNPLHDWSLDRVKTYVADHHVPYNVLHDKGFVSIGCAPCTRAIQEGEDFRAGRWWWESSSKKECGLHTQS